MGRRAHLAERLAWLTIAACSTALAAPRIVVGEFQGDTRQVLARQVSQAVCGAHLTCVAPKGLMQRKGFNWQRLKRAKVVGAYMGFVHRTARGPALMLSLSTGPEVVAGSWTLVLKGGRLSQVALEHVRDESEALLAPALASAPTAPPPQVASSTPPAAEPPHAEAPPPSAPPSPPPPPEPKVEASPPPAAERPPAPPAEPEQPRPSEREPEERSAVGAPLFALELGPEGLQRTFGYSNLVTANLRSYSSALLISPYVRADLFPLRLITDGLLSGLGLWADDTFATWYTTSESCSGGSCTGDAFKPHSTRYHFGNAALQWRIPVGAVLALTPSVGYHWGGFTVGADAAGSYFPNFPGVAQDGLLLQLEVEVLLGGRVKLLARGADIPAISGGQLLSPAFFHGKGTAFDVAAGLGVIVARGLEVRVYGLYDQARYTFQSAPTDAYQATGANDRYVGARLTVRYAFETP